ncbi:MAG: RNA polymerase sigma factor WhiG [Actinomycetota bacterium]|jgi:RNA polymerase sigma factor for flagellar operon FliA|nr:RNA polymerase sigma factor WhiG [Actinomycetota bacterium]MCL6093024.1 RNA polymerase sigma factor WhiG [Actinomycetota bacterium]MDA8167353.1 RNA polymerase sigma factor WhiG [Actinomycetota bacterium]
MSGPIHGRAVSDGKMPEDDKEIIELWRRYKQGADPVARDRLILTYAPLVKYVAGRMGTNFPSHVEESDLISYGLLGLIGAIERFDLSRNIKFETYAITRIKGSILDELRSLDWVPRSVRSMARQIERSSAKLENKLHRAPSDEEMASDLGLTMDEFRDALTRISSSTIVALEELWTISSTGTESVALIDTIEDRQSKDPAAVVDVNDVKERLAGAISNLPEREKIVIALYYYEGLTLREIGDVLGVTESRVSQLHTKAILRLKGRLKDQVEPAQIQ